MKYTFIKQHDATDCAAACLAMVCLHYNKETTISRLRDIMGTDIKGTNLIGLSKCADELGFTSQAVRVDKEGFLSKFTLPAIANVIEKGGLSHFVVVFKITKKYVIVGDPAKELQKISFDDFFSKFTGAMLLLVPNNKFSTDKIKGKSVYSRYIKFLLPQKKLFAYSIIASLIITVFGILSSLFNKILMDEIIPYRLKNKLVLILIIFILLTITNVAVSFLRQWIMLYLSQKIDIPLMLGYFEHIYKLPMSFFSTRKTGDIITRFSDAVTIKNIFTNIALTLIIDIVMAFATGLMLFKMNTSLFIVIVCMTVISILLIIIFKHPYKKINEEQMQQASILNSQIIEGLRSVETIKGNASEELELNSIEKEYIKSLRIDFKEGFLSNIQGSSSELVSAIGSLVLMYFGAMQVINGTITLGSMMAFVTLSSYFMEPVGRLVSLQLQIQESNISMKRMSEILDCKREEEFEDESSKYIDIDKIHGDIEIKNLVFRYGNRKPVLKNINITIPKGKKVAVVGTSGSGKSTLAKLLLKYYKPESGEILIDGIDINEYTNSSIRKAISYVPQTIELFSKSIYENIRISNMNASLEDVKDAAKQAKAHDFIKKLPLQYDTYLQEAGNGLSGGEKQRIALARAFLKKNEFYIFDESTSNLDFYTENILFDTIYNKYNTKSMLIIAHRLATVINCDNIIVLENGEILEQGNHEELLNKQGKYYTMWQMQQGNFHMHNDKELDENIVSDKEIISDENEMSYL